MLEALQPVLNVIAGVALVGLIGFIVIYAAMLRS